MCGIVLGGKTHQWQGYLGMMFLGSGRVVAVASVVATVEPIGFGVVPLPGAPVGLTGLPVVFPGVP